jgi:hypothetical protein
MDQFSPDPFTALSPEEEAAQRAGARDSLLLAATLWIDGTAAPAQVRVRNLSPGGLMAEYEPRVALGTPLTIEVRGIGPVKGHVAWATSGRIGIAFEVEIDPLKARKPVGPGRRR